MTHPIIEPAELERITSLLLYVQKECIQLRQERDALMTQLAAVNTELSRLREEGERDPGNELAKVRHELAYVKGGYGNAILRAERLGIELRKAREEVEDLKRAYGELTAGHAHDEEGSL